MNDITPPALARVLLRLAPLGGRRAEVEADLLELLAERTEAHGLRYARRRYYRRRPQPVEKSRNGRAAIGPGNLAASRAGSRTGCVIRHPLAAAQSGPGGRGGPGTRPGHRRRDVGLHAADGGHVPGHRHRRSGIDGPGHARLRERQRNVLALLRVPDPARRRPPRVRRRLVPRRHFDCFRRECRNACQYQRDLRERWLSGQSEQARDARSAADARPTTSWARPQSWSSATACGRGRCLPIRTSSAGPSG